MMKSEWLSLLSGATATALETGSDEWAYYHLTSKMEDPIRNRIAYGLQRQLEKIGRAEVVARGGWVTPGDARQFDIRVVGPDGAPRMLAEAKLLYGFDVLQNGPRFLTRSYASHGADAERLGDFAHAGIECYILSFLVHPMADRIPGRITRHMKYSAGHHRATRRYGFEDLRIRSREDWGRDLEAFGDVTTYSVKLGQAFDVPVELDLFIAGPLGG